MEWSECGSLRTAMALLLNQSFNNLHFSFNSAAINQMSLVVLLCWMKKRKSWWLMSCLRPQQFHWKWNWMFSSSFHEMKWVELVLPQLLLHSTIKDCWLRIVGYRFPAQLVTIQPSFISCFICLSFPQSTISEERERWNGGLPERKLITHLRGNEKLVFLWSGGRSQPFHSSLFTKSKDKSFNLISFFEWNEENESN